MSGVVLVALGSFLNLIPAIGKYPIDVLTTIISALLITYAILRYQLLDITVVVRKGLLYAIPTAIIGAGYFFIVFLAVNLLHVVAEYQVLLLALFVAAVTAVVTQPLRNRVQAWVDRLFFREKYDASLMLQRLSRTAASVLDLDRLTNMILDEVTATMHIRRAAFFLRQEESGDYRLMAQRGLDQSADLRLRKDHPIVEWLADHEWALTRREVEVMPQFKALWGQEREDLERLGAELFIPLKAKGELVGVFAVGPKLSEEAYSQDDQLTLTTLANQTAVAIENARLHQETKRRLEEMATLRETALDISAQLEMSSVLRSIIERVTKLLGAKGGDIYLYDEAKRELRVAVSHNPWGDYTGRTLKLGEGLAGKVVLEGKAMSVADYAAWPGHSPEYVGEPFKAVASVPLKWRGRIIGALNVADDAEDRVFDEDDLRLLELFAPQAAIAIENARLFEAEAKRRREAETLRQASLALTAALDRNQVIERILAQLQQVVPYDSASVQLLEGDRLVIIGGRGFPNLEELLGISFPVNGNNPNRVVMHTLKPFILEDAPAVYKDFKKEPFAAMNIRSWLGVPMLIGNRPVGMITLDKCQPGFYTEEHARLAQAFATHAAIAIENARLYEEVQRELAERKRIEEALRRSEERFRSLAETANDAIITIDSQGNIAFWNPAAETMFGYSAAEVIGKPITTLMPERFREAHRKGLKRVVSTGETKIIGKTVELIGLRKDGSEFPFELSMAIWKTREGPFFTAIVRDITKRKQAEEELRQRNRHLSALQAVAATLSRSLDLDEILHGALDKVLEVTELEVAGIQLLDESGERLLLQAHRGLSETFCQAIAEVRVADDPIAKWVLTSGEPLVVAKRAEVEEKFKAEASAEGLGSFAAFPLRSADRILGLMVVQSRGYREFSTEEVALLTAIGNQIGLAIEKAQLYQRTKEHLRELQALQETTATLQSSLSLQEVLNRIVKAIVGLGYPAAMLAQYEEETNRLVIRTYSVDPALLEMGEALAKKKMMGAYVTLDQTENLGVRMALAGEIGITHSLHDLFRPLVSAEVCRIVQEMAGIKTMATIPLLAKGRLVGNMFVGTEREEISERELDSLRAFANQAALAIENAQLYEETIQAAEQMASLFEEAQARVRELAALTEVGEAINRALSLEETLNIVLREAMSLVGREEGSIILLDRRTNTLRIVASQGLPPKVVEAFNARPVYAHEGTFGIVIKTGEMLEIPNARSDPRVLHEAGHVPEQLTNVPLRTKEGVIGVIALDDLPPDDRARRLLKALADLAAVAIQRAQLFEETQRHLRELHLLFEVGRGITSVLDLEEVLQTIIESAIEAIPAAEKGSLHLLDEETGELVVRASSGFSQELIEAVRFKPGEGLAGWVFEHQEPAIVDNVHTDPRFKPVDLPEVVEEKSAICTPLIAKGKAIGTLSLDNLTTYGAFDENDLELLRAFANQAAIAIENARLYSQAQRRLTELALLYEVAMAGTAALDLEDALQRIAEALHRHSPFENLGILLLDEATGELKMKATVGFDPQATERLGLRLGRGITGWVAQTGQPALVPDVSRDPRYKRCTPGMRSELCVPIRIGKRVIGVINTESSRPNAFSEEDLKLLTTLAGQVATIIESARLFEETQRLAVTDGLTGLYNRRHFYELLEEEIVRAGRKGVLSLIMLDIDDFKAYNDTYGHLAGDALLRELAQLFRRGTRQGDIVARYGGEEFVIILPDTDKEEAVAMAERIRVQVEKHLFEGEEGMPAGRITVSLGVASYPQDARDPEALVNAADVALYEAKKRRNRVCVYGSGTLACLPQGVPVR